MEKMKTSEAGLALIRKFEGCVLKAYRCPAGVWTIGYGHTGGVRNGEQIDKVRAEELLAEDVERVEDLLCGKFKNGMPQRHFDVLVSFIFNIGWDAFSASTLCRFIMEKAGDRAVCQQLLRWHNAAGKPLLGLMKRRVEEANLWMGREAYKVINSGDKWKIVEL